MDMKQWQIGCHTVGSVSWRTLEAGDCCVIVDGFQQPMLHYAIMEVDGFLTNGFGDA